MGNADPSPLLDVLLSRGREPYKSIAVVDEFCQDAYPQSSVE